MQDTIPASNTHGKIYAAFGMMFTLISVVALSAILVVKTRADVTTDQVPAISTGLSGMANASGTNDYLQVVNAATYSWTAGASWTIAKQAEPAVLTLKKGRKGTVKYTVTATKGDGPVLYAVEGMVCVKNTHSAPTEELTIVNEIQAQDNPEDDFYLFANAEVDLGAKPVLQAGEEYCYPYATTFEPEVGLKYRDHALVMISTSVPASDAPCPKPFICSSAIEVATSLDFPMNDVPAQSSSIVVDDLGSDADGRDEDCGRDDDDDGDWYCFNWPGHRYGEPDDHNRHCFRWKGHHYGTDNNDNKKKNGIFYKIQTYGRGRNDNSRDGERCREDEPQRTWQFTESGSQSYTETYECNQDSGKHVNTAVIRGTDQKATAEVTVKCVR